jgi:hypothetical protein
MCEHTVSKHPTLPKTAEELLKESVRVQMERAKDLPHAGNRMRLRRNGSAPGLGFRKIISGD